MKEVRKILNQGNKPWLLSLLAIGLSVLLVILMLGILTIKYAGPIMAKGEGILSPQLVVVHKEVGLLNMLAKGGGFSDGEIAMVRQKPFILKAAPFRSNLFKASLIVDLPLTALQTDIFLESIPQEILGATDFSFRWKPGRDVPIILPNDFINLYNFGFAPSQGQPKVSPEILKKVPIRLRVSGKENMEIEAYIAGFTDKVSTLLVPDPFLEYMNQKIGTAQKAEVLRLALVTRQAADPKFEQLLNEKGWKTNEELLRGAKIQSVFQSALWVLASLGVIFLFFSMLTFFQYIQLFQVRMDKELDSLLRLGFHPFEVTRQWIRGMSFWILFAWGLAWLVFYFLQKEVIQVFEQWGFVSGQEKMGWGEEALLPLLLSILILLFNAIWFHLGMKRLSRYV